MAENGSYKPILKSPLHDLREANKDCPLYLDKEKRKGWELFPLKNSFVLSYFVDVLSPLSWVVVWCK